jgi:hypothetical protein
MTSTLQDVADKLRRYKSVYQTYQQAEKELEGGVEYKMRPLAQWSEIPSSYHPRVIPEYPSRECPSSTVGVRLVSPFPLSAALRESVEKQRVNFRLSAPYPLSFAAWFELASACLLEILGEPVDAEQMLGPILGEIFERLRDE